MVLLSPAQQVDIEADVSALLSSRPQRPRELTYSQLSRRSSGEKFVEQAFEVLEQRRARVFFALVEKTYLAASFLVETFLDPLCSDRVPAEFGKKKMRIMASNLVYSV